MSAIVMRNCNLFDGYADEAVPGMHVLVNEGVIEAVSDKPIDAKGAIEVDVGGRTLLPGLIDAHVHVFAVSLEAARNETMPLTLMTARAVPRIRNLIDRGFTTVRDVGAGDVGIRDAIDLGYIQGPRLFVGGPAMSQTGGHGDHRRRTDNRYDIDYNANAFVFFSHIVDGADEMRRAVRNELRKGADHIKVMACGGCGSPSDQLEHIQFTTEELETAVYEARARGKYVCAHTYTNEAIQHAVIAGVRTIEHANFIDTATATVVAAHDAFVVPTLGCYELSQKRGKGLGLSPFVLEKLSRVIKAGAEMLDNCQLAGAKMGFGTDLMGELEFAQSQEFAIRGRVQKGVDVIRSATSINAEIVQRVGKLGTIAPGALADMIVCDGNPLNDINLLAEPEKNLRLIMKGGNFHKNQLDTRQA